MSINIKYLGHASFLIKIKNKTILTDPYFSSKPIGKLKRITPCYLTLEKLPQIDNILISHEHTDSFDIDATNYISNKFNSKVISHESVLNKIKVPTHNKVTIDEFQTRKVNDIKIKAYPAHHPSSFYPLSYVLENEQGKSIYFAGDTNITKDHDTIKPNIAILPIGGVRTMDLISAIRVSKKMRPEHIIPMHYNTFEDIQKNPHELKYKLEKTSYNINTVILNPGKCFKYK